MVQLVKCCHGSISSVPRILEEKTGHGDSCYNPKTREAETGGHLGPNMLVESQAN